MSPMKTRAQKTTADDAKTLDLQHFAVPDTTYDTYFHLSYFLFVPSEDAFLFTTVVNEKKKRKQRQNLRPAPLLSRCVGRFPSFSSDQRHRLPQEASACSHELPGLSSAPHHRHQRSSTQRHYQAERRQLSAASLLPISPSPSPTGHVEAINSPSYEPAEPATVTRAAYTTLRVQKNLRRPRPLPPEGFKKPPLIPTVMPLSTFRRPERRRHKPKPLPFPTLLQNRRFSSPRT